MLRASAKDGLVQFLRSRTTLLTPKIQELLRAQPVGVTLGNFDGLHLGHLALFETLERELAKRTEAPKQPLKILVTFSPHPKQVLNRITRREAGQFPEFFKLTALRTKVEFARKHQFSFFYNIRFSISFSMLAPDEFVRLYLVHALQAKLVVVGHDWKFGRGRSGTPEYLRALGEKFGFQVIVVDPVKVGELRVSSSALRESLARGDLTEAEQMLGRPFSVIGRVIHGESRGRTLGFPTANVHLPRQFLPKNGVYAVTAEWSGGRAKGVANIGVRPTFGGGARLLEVHLLDQPNLDLYGERLQVAFVSYLREEEKFSKVEDLKRAIERDILRAREVLTEQCQ